VISPRRYVYLTMVRETMLDYYSEIKCTAPADSERRREMGKVPEKIVRKAETEA
jgi:hypothetical protein